LVKQTISRAVKEAVDRDLSIQDSLQYRYGNISAIARLIGPKVEASVNHKVNIESLITSIKRIRGDYKAPPADVTRIISGSMINVRTDIAKISIENTKRSLETVRKMLAVNQEEFIQVSESISAITLIIDQRMIENIIAPLNGDVILEKEINLAAIIINSPETIVKTPGCLTAFYNQVSRRHVNIEDTVSCFTDTIIVVRMKDVGQAFAALTDLISESRKNFPKSWSQV
jgi:hypothetical protein|tara:strand:- start:130 stop:816 length:687 start_codon:yes stop_codon:yes gene_type:complete